MKFSSKSQPETPRSGFEALESLIERGEKLLIDLQNATFEMNQSTSAAARVMKDLKKATERSESVGRRKLSSR